MPVGLTSPALIALLAVLAGGLLAAALACWGRLARAGLARVAGRVGIVGALDLLVLALILAIANDAGGFYASWSELFGTAHASGHVVSFRRPPTPSAGRVAGTGSHAGQLAVVSRMPVAVPGKPRARGGRLLGVRMTGQISGIPAAGYLYVPERALLPGGRRRPLPVIVVLSDRLGSKASAFSARAIAATAASQMAAGRLQPSLLVMLPPAVAAGAGSSCLDAPGGPQAATFFTQDLPQLISSRFRVSTGTGRWALAADGSGAYCALQLALTNSAVYSVAAAPPGYYLPPPAPGTRGPGGPAGRALREQRNLIWLLGHQPMQPVSVLLTGPAAQAGPFLRLARPPMRVTAASGISGRWPLAPVLDWIGRSLGTRS